MKKVLNWMLMAAVVCGLGLNVSSCSDDDDDNGVTREPDSATNISGTMEEDILRHFITLWCDVQKDELIGNWTSKTYEPTVGFVTDESQPFVRTIQVDSIQGADNYALDCFGAFGIDSDNPDGFTYDNKQVGKVTYRHASNGGNVLATIDVENISQMPTLRQIQLVKTLPSNVGGNGYYRVGDVIRYKNRLWVCASDHRQGEKAKFITFTSNDDCTIGTFNWSGVGKDSVYTNEMADASTLRQWITNILIVDKYFYGVRESQVEKRGIYDILTAKGFQDQIKQIVPQTTNCRLDLVRALFSARDLVTNVSGYSRQHIDCSWTDDVDRVGNGVATYHMAPHGYLLANKMRYAIGTITNASWHQWVPYVMCATFDQWGIVFEQMDGNASQSTLDPDHFEWSHRIVWNYNMSDTLARRGVVGNIGKFYVYTAAFYWQHEYSYLDADPNPEVANAIGWGKASRVLMNFTRDWKNHPDEMFRRNYVRNPDLWTNRNITSKELTFTDNGRKKTDYEDVFIRPYEPELENQQ